MIQIWIYFYLCPLKEVMQNQFRADYRNKWISPSVNKWIILMFLLSYMLQSRGKLQGWKVKCPKLQLLDRPLEAVLIDSDLFIFVCICMMYFYILFRAEKPFTAWLKKLVLVLDQPKFHENCESVVAGLNVFRKEFLISTKRLFRNGWYHEEFVFYTQSMVLLSEHFHCYNRSCTIKRQ